MIRRKPSKFTVTLKPYNETSSNWSYTSKPWSPRGAAEKTHRVIIDDCGCFTGNLLGKFRVGYNQSIKN